MGIDGHSCEVDQLDPKGYMSPMTFLPAEGAMVICNAMASTLFPWGNPSTPLQAFALEKPSPFNQDNCLVYLILAFAPTSTITVIFQVVILQKQALQSCIVDLVVFLHHLCNVWVNTPNQENNWPKVLQ